MCAGTGLLLAAALDTRAVLGINVEKNRDYFSFSLAAPGSKTGPAWVRAEEQSAVHLGEIFLMEFSILESAGTKEKGKPKKKVYPLIIRSAKSSRNSRENLCWLQSHP